MQEFPPFCRILIRRGNITIKTSLKNFSLACLLGAVFVLLIAGVIIAIRQIPVSLKSYEIGLISAILGGIVSGGLTLIGVKATLNNQYNKDFKDLYPRRKMILDEEIEVMGKIISFIENEIINSINNSQRLDDRIKLMESLIENATIVNGETYENTKKFIQECKKIENLLYNFYQDAKYDPIKGNYNELDPSILQSNKQFIESTKQLNLYKDNLVSQLKKMDKKYKELTGM
ncbi:hypothetical protein ACTNEO_04985 [Gracilibacillus sp. HCP3S3_G5_1]|uniref:hypothetical protein n=1 Tax=unclassified Gracilibacillus TaxID=2625209 RepID=UPI003F89A0D0